MLLNFNLYKILDTVNTSNYISSKKSKFILLNNKLYNYNNNSH